MLCHAGFRGAQRDVHMLKVVPPAVDTQADQEHEEGDPDPCPEDEDFFVGPDSASMEEVICKFLDGLEGQHMTVYTCS